MSSGLPRGQNEIAALTSNLSQKKTACQPTSPVQSKRN
ncbi:hypothetical protein T4E_10773 [Trichinella pseudospiralis]|uniref:Uncharacterized protein n=1 Tax=Trichinella pseudospiralis TaxID=6337 RepID=A0A0V0XDN6_TRIPS|nr:hypothetical protein T4E_10773 [Trichinella pseudospiralis]